MAGTSRRLVSVAQSPLRCRCMHMFILRLWLGLGRLPFHMAKKGLAAGLLR